MTKIQKDEIISNAAQEYPCTYHESNKSHKEKLIASNAWILEKIDGQYEIGSISFKSCEIENAAFFVKNIFKLFSQICFVKKMLNLKLLRFSTLLSTL